MKDGTVGAWDIFDRIAALMDGRGSSDVELRDVKRFLRKERRLSQFDRALIEDVLLAALPTTGPFFYPGNIDLLEGAASRGSGQCVALLQHSQPIGSAFK